jgi:hypothetical protein
MSREPRLILELLRINISTLWLLASLNQPDHQEITSYQISDKITKSRTVSFTPLMLRLGLEHGTMPLRHHQVPHPVITSFLTSDLIRILRIVWLIPPLLNQD